MQKLNEKGIENAAALVGGTAAWENAGYPMESSQANKSNDNKNSNPKPDAPKSKNP